MTFRVVINNCYRCSDLRRRVREYDAFVNDCDGQVYVYASSLTNGEYNELWEICKEFGDVSIVDEL